MMKEKIHRITLLPVCTDAKRVGLLADPRNDASVRVAERAGFEREGVLRS